MRDPKTWYIKGGPKFASCLQRLESKYKISFNKKGTDNSTAYYINDESNYTDLYGQYLNQTGSREEIYISEFEQIYEFEYGDRITEVTDKYSWYVAGGSALSKCISELNKLYENEYGYIPFTYSGTGESSMYFVKQSSTTTENYFTDIDYESLSHSIIKAKTEITVDEFKKICKIHIPKMLTQKMWYIQGSDEFADLLISFEKKYGVYFNCNGRDSRYWYYVSHFDKIYDLSYKQFKPSGNSEFKTVKEFKELYLKTHQPTDYKSSQKEIIDMNKPIDKVTSKPYYIVGSYTFDTALTELSSKYDIVFDTHSSFIQRQKDHTAFVILDLKNPIVFNPISNSPTHLVDYERISVANYIKLIEETYVPTMYTNKATPVMYSPHTLESIKNPCDEQIENPSTSDLVKLNIVGNIKPTVKKLNLFNF